MSNENSTADSSAAARGYAHRVKQLKAANADLRRLLHEAHEAHSTDEWLERDMDIRIAKALGWA